MNIFKLNPKSNSIVREKSDFIAIVKNFSKHIKKFKI